MKLWIAIPLFALAACEAKPSEGSSSALAGVYHLVDVHDTTNLELRADGTFVVETQACDFYGGTEGLWSTDGDDLVLVAAGAGDESWREGVCPSACFRWPYIGPEGEGLSAPVEELRMREQADGTWRASFFGHIQQREITDQRVDVGGVCLTCGVGEAPCDDPFSHDPWPEG